MAPSTEDVGDLGEWVFHPRHAKLYRPVARDDEHVVMLSVWHPEEVADARECGVLLTADEVGLVRTETTFDLLDSFRFLDEETIAAVRETLDE